MIEQVDADPETDGAYFMVNCAHPTHFDSVLGAGGAWVERFVASAPTRRPSFTEVLGGCCGTDIRHVERIAATAAS